MIRAANPSPQGRRGFAIVMTVLLLGLLVVVVVSLATITGVETGIAGNTRKFSQARQNALMALNIAIGELQMAAGPDQRVSARADITSLGIDNPHWTGIWNSDGTTGPIVWLVSGNEDGASAFVPSDSTNVLPTSSALSDDLTLSTAGEDLPARLLVGENTGGSDSNDDGTPDAGNYVVAPIVNIVAPFPDLPPDTIIGHYAWWIGDEGVKASLALPDRLDDVDYGPYAVEENRRRLRQQVPFGHEHFDTVGSTFGFDPADPGNHVALANAVTQEQLRFLDPLSSSGNYTTFLRAGFHTFTPAAYGVLASTHPDFPGLKRDLSVAPSLLGAAFQAWSGRANMEAPVSGNTAEPPIESEGDFRRRYLFTTPPDPDDWIADSIVHSVSPVISDFIIQFGVRIVGNSVQVASRMHIAIWNPYSSALVVEPLQLEVSGLPTIRVEAFNGGADPVEEIAVDLNTLFSAPGDPLTVALPFAGDQSSTTSWLPGRVYNWRTNPTFEESTLLPVNLAFDFKRLANTNGWIQTAPGSFTVSGPYWVSGPSTSVVATVKNATGDVLCQFKGPEMPATGPTPTDWTFVPRSSPPPPWDFAFGFRLLQPSTAAGSFGDDWLIHSDLRNPYLVGAPLLGAHNPAVGLNPTDYRNDDVRTEWNGAGVTGYILNRLVSAASSNWLSYNGDTPVFELPRLPVLSLGELQHLHIAGQRPFAVGNSWGASIMSPDDPDGMAVGSWFDRFFFSGVSASGPGPDLSIGQALPYYHFRTFDPDGTLSLSTFRSAANATTSRHLLMAGAFNINSTSIDAWDAVLKSLRPSAVESWYVVDPNPDTGSPGESPDDDDTGIDGVTVQNITDSTVGSLSPSNRAVGFFRFPQTAQETFTTGATTSGADAPSGINRSKYRQGIRGGDSGVNQQAGRNLTSVQIATMATSIVTRIRDHFDDVVPSHPFLSMEEFLGPTAPGSPSIIEEAISDSGINAGLDADDFSSYRLTQADILTALAPMLQARSDTFVVRTYGESVNPITNAVEGRAWCEAIVQRVPTPVDPDDISDPDRFTAPVGVLGRRFKITSFRWLTPADI